MRRFVLLILVCISVFDFVQIDSGAQSAASTMPEEAPLRAVIESYYAACGKKDLAGVMAMWSEKSPNLAAYKQTLQQQFASEDLSYGSPAVSRVKVENERANLRATIALTSINLKSQQKSERRLILNFELVKEGGVWKVWRSASAAEDLAEALVKASSQTERAALLTEERELEQAELGQALLAQGRRLYSTQGHYDRAKEIFELALELAGRSGEGRVRLRALQGIGAVNQSQGDYAQALEHYQKSLKISQEIGDKASIPYTLNNIGLVHGSQGNYLQALEHYQKGLKIFEEVSDKAAVAVTLNNIGIVHKAQGDYAQALEQYLKSLKISEEIGDKVNVARTLNNIGVVHKAQGDYARALEQYQKGLKISEELGFKVIIASTLNNIGNVHISQGNYAQALEQYQKSLKISEEIGNKYLIASTLNNVGDVHTLQDNYAQALEQYRKSLKISEETGDKASIALALNGAGKAYQLSGELQMAMENYHQAMRLRREIGERPGEAENLLGIAQVEQKRGNLPLARQTIEQAIGIIESLRANITRQESRAFYFASQQNYYESYIDVLMAQHLRTPAAGIDAAAFAISERARARSLIELLTESRVDIRHGVEPSLLERERSLQQQLNARAAAEVALLNRKHTSAQAEAAAKEIAAITDEYEEIKAQIRARSPRYAALTQPQPLSLTEIQQQAIDEDTLLLEYALGEKRSYLWLVSRRSIDSYELPPRAEIEAATRRVYELLTARPKPRTPPDPQLIAQAKTLSKMLLGPVAQQLGGKRLVVVAPGALSYLPFAALPSPEDKKRPAGGYEPLIAKHEVVSIPSASVLSLIRREMAGRQRAAKSIAVLADPVFEESDPRLAPAKEGDSSRKTPAAPGPATADAKHSDLTRAISTMKFPDDRAGFTRLPFSRQEAESIFAMTPEGTGLKATDFNASRALALSPQMSEYRIVHFATHGLLNSERPELSGLVFSLIDQGGKQQDGFLRLHEVYNLQLKADLVVLSACETGLGKEIKGEGLIGLTRGFMYAGAPRVVASLWNVDDFATAKLMELFYRGMLKDGLPASAALRAAQLELSGQKRWASPYFWAGFVLHGEWK